MTDEQDRLEIAGKVFPKDRRPPAKPAGKIIFIADSAATPSTFPVYSDGTAWRRFSDNTVIS